MDEFITSLLGLGLFIGCFVVVYLIGRVLTED